MTKGTEVIVSGPGHWFDGMRGEVVASRGGMNIVRVGKTELTFTDSELWIPRNRSVSLVPEEGSALRRAFC